MITEVTATPYDMDNWYQIEQKEIKQPKQNDLSTALIWRVGVKIIKIMDRVQINQEMGVYL